MRINRLLFGIIVVLLAMDAKAQPDTWTNRFWKSKLVVEPVVDSLKVKQRVADIYKVRSRNCDIQCLKGYLEKSGVSSFMQDGTLTWISKGKTITLCLKPNQADADGYMISSIKEPSGVDGRNWLGVDERAIIMDIESGAGSAVNRTLLVRAKGPSDVVAIVRRLLAKGYSKKFMAADSFYMLDRVGEEIVLQSLADHGQWSVLVIQTKESG